MGHIFESIANQHLKFIPNVHQHLSSVGAGGIIINPGVNTTIKYACGLGTMSNTEAEAFSLFKGIRLALSTKIQRITICRDYMMVIRDIFNNNMVVGNIYTSVISQILALLNNFEDYSLFHIK
jgi:ribonuclease HI